MRNYKSVQDLIVKAALYDGVSTTIRATERFGGVNALEITFQKDHRYSGARIDLLDVGNHEEMSLYVCKSALRKLLWDPYDEIVVNEGNNYEN